MLSAASISWDFMDDQRAGKRWWDSRHCFMTGLAGMLYTTLKQPYPEVNVH
jgi:hypothetical protein